MALPSAERGRTAAPDQIPRASLAMLLVAQLAVIAPLALHVSIWIVVVWLFCGGWRVQVYRGRWGYPPGWVKAVLVFASFIGIAFSGFRAFSLEAATSLLVLAYALKLLEMKSRRDAYLMVYLSYFLVATAFLYEQTMAVSTYALVCMMLVTAVMVGLNQLQSRVRPLASFWTAGAIVLQALPFTLVIFMLFPRVDPLWSIPMPSAQSTGLSDRMTPGDVARLSRSDELAFRAVFDGEVPPVRELYWRGLVYSEFRRGTWTLGPPLERFAAPFGAQGIGYQVFLEPTQNKWLYTLDVPVRFEDSRMSMLGDFRLVADEPVLSVMRYRVTSNADVTLDPVLDERVRARELALPPLDNPRMRDFALDLYARTGSAEEMIRAMLAHIRERPYRYTLSPPVLPREGSIDRFWFDTRAGFCTHYAGAMVFALRAAGVPARMIGGYQGGEINPVSGHVVVRQYQAHAWIEAWLDGRGWVRVDPTAAVAPERVESGLEAALSSEERAELPFFSSARASGTLLADALIWADSLEHRWNLWVVGYDRAMQTDILSDVLGGITPIKIGFAILVGGAATLLLVALSLFWRRRPRQRHPVERLFQKFCAGVARLGYERAPGETPSAFVERLARAAGWDGATLARTVQTSLYDPRASVSLAQRQRLRADLRNLKFRLAFGTSLTAS